MLGFTTSILFYAIGAAYTLGAYLVQNKLFDMDLERIMLVFGCIMFGAQSVGMNKLTRRSFLNVVDKIFKFSF
jgi:hypothetical protein